jgi:hypothetical protein
MRRADAARRLILFTIALAVAGRLSAQVNWRPTPAPIVTANNETWFLSGEAITFSGSYYFPTGPQVFFDGNRMVRTGSYRGVPLYADTTLEPYAKLFVPLSGGLLQPYERKRTGDLAGSTGSQAPSFPVSTSGEARAEEAAPGEVAQAPAPPVFSEPSDLLEARTMTDAAEAGERAARSPETRGGRSTKNVAVPVSAAGRVGPERRLVQLGMKPLGLNEVYVIYGNARWRSAGRAVRYSREQFVQVGTYQGFPVYAGKNDAQSPLNIYLPSRDDLVAPYERAGNPVRY